MRPDWKYNQHQDANKENGITGHNISSWQLPLI
jgi:hypothetical protein